MRLRRLLVAVSLLLNAALLLELYFREQPHRIDGFTWDAQAPAWAAYAGRMQAERHFAGGVRRLYRPAPAASFDDRCGFTGTREGEAEVWTWVYHPDSGDAARSSAEAFADAYNQRMRKYLADPGRDRPPHPPTARLAD